MVAAVLDRNVMGVVESVRLAAVLGTGVYGEHAPTTGVGTSASSAKKARMLGVLMRVSC
jgi:hypothetical protein